VALNDDGDAMYFADLDGDSTTDDTIWINSTLIAQEEGPSPIGGRTWATLSSPELDLNNKGEYVFSGSLNGDSASNLLIDKKGTKFKQEGDSVTTDNGTFSLTSFGSGPILIDDFGNVLWYGDWDDANTDEDTGLFLNDLLLVQEGVTSVSTGRASHVVDTVRGITEGYDMSDSGEWIILRADFVGSLDAAVVIHVVRPPGDCDGDGDVDLDDLHDFTDCLAGPGGGLVQPDCDCFDLEPSGDIDLGDFAQFQLEFTDL
jgi:hypothetical protein